VVPVVLFANSGRGRLNNQRTRGIRWRRLNSRHFGENAFQVIVRDGFNQMMIKSSLKR
jgi:hypothetical protein